jgi:hypothetical protein
MIICGVGFSLQRTLVRSSGGVSMQKAWAKAQPQAEAWPHSGFRVRWDYRCSDWRDTPAAYWVHAWRSLLVDPLSALRQE